MKRKRYKLVVLYNPVEGREADFNQWLDDTHVPDLLAVDGIVGARRLRLAMTQTQPADETVHRYLTLYDIETEDIEAFHRMLLAGRAHRQSSDAVDRSNNSARYFEVLGPGVPGFEALGFEAPGEES
jgi:hypothetical protein